MKKYNFSVSMFLVVTIALLSNLFAETTFAYWKPAINTSWQYQLSGTIDQSVNAQMYVVDGFDTSAATVAALHAKGKKVICYFSAGSAEDWRPDYSQFPASVKGKSLDDWAGETWLDIRNLSVLKPIMTARIDMCKQKGFDGIDPDNVDGYTNATGFPLTSSAQLTYNRFLADTAHARDLSVGLKNDIDQASTLVNSFDWQINEECFKYNECNQLTTFITNNKPVFNVEYTTNTKVCTKANALNFNTILKKLSLNAWRYSCR